MPNRRYHPEIEPGDEVTARDLIRVLMEYPDARVSGDISIEIPMIYNENYEKTTPGQDAAQRFLDSAKQGGFTLEPGLDATVRELAAESEAIRARNRVIAKAEEEAWDVEIARLDALLDGGEVMELEEAIATVLARVKDRRDWEVSHLDKHINTPLRAGKKPQPCVRKALGHGSFQCSNCYWYYSALRKLLREWS